MRKNIDRGPALMRASSTGSLEGFCTITLDSALDRCGSGPSSSTWLLSCNADIILIYAFSTGWWVCVVLLNPLLLSLQSNDYHVVRIKVLSIMYATCYQSLLSCFFILNAVLLIRSVVCRFSGMKHLFFKKLFSHRPYQSAKFLLQRKLARASQRYDVATYSHSQYHSQEKKIATTSRQFVSRCDQCLWTLNYRYCYGEAQVVQVLRRRVYLLLV